MDALMKYQCRSVAEIIFAYSMADCGMIPDGAPEFKIIVREHKPNRRMIRSLARLIQFPQKLSMMTSPPLYIPQERQVRPKE